MAHQDEMLVIGHGPSKLDLMLSLFDTDMGVRAVRFQVAKYDCDFNLNRAEWLDVRIISARRRHPSAKFWALEGIVQTHSGEKRVSIYYTTDTRKGFVYFEKKLLTSDPWETAETVSDARKRKALIEIIFRMINRYRESHPGNLDNEMFRLFEKAKRVDYAENENLLTEAIKNIQD